MTVKHSRRVTKVIQSVARLFADRPAPARTPPALKYGPGDDVETLSTGFRPLDKALDLGGLPCGKITELIGGGQTSLSGGANSIAAKIASKVQRKQQVVTIIDMNHSFDPWQAERCGLIAPHLLLTRPDTVFDALTTLESAVRKSSLILVVMGIVPELLGQADPESLSTLAGRLRSIVRQSSSAFLLVTSPLTNDPFALENYPAGFPLIELAAIRLLIQEESWSYQDGVPSAYKANLTVIQNRLAVAGKGADIRIKFNNY